MHNINDIWLDVVKKYLYVTHCYKLGMKIAKFGIIDQHMNACHMSNAIFGKDFDLGALDSFCYVWTCLYSWMFWFGFVT